MNFIDMDVKIMKWCKGFIVYLKDVNKIEDFLRYIGVF